MDFGCCVVRVAGRCDTLPMKTIPAIECTRPVCYKVPNPDCPYNTGGTCFVVRFRGRLWAFTAKHVLTNFGILVDQVLIPYKVGSYHFFPIADARTFQNYPKDSDCTDIILFEIDEAHIEPEHFDPTTVYDLDSEPDFTVQGDMLLAIHGFPTALNIADKDEQALFHQPLSIPGHFGDRSAMTACREVNLLNDGGITDHDGFSGCPIFIASSEFGQATPSKLIGINLRGSAAKLKKHYLDVVALKQLVDVHLKRNACPPLTIN